MVEKLDRRDTTFGTRAAMVIYMDNLLPEYLAVTIPDRFLNRVRGFLGIKRKYTTRELHDQFDELKRTVAEKWFSYLRRCNEDNEIWIPCSDKNRQTKKFKTIRDTRAFISKQFGEEGLRSLTRSKNKQGEWEVQ